MYPVKRPYSTDEIICPHCGKPMTLLPKKNWSVRTVEHWPHQYDNSLANGEYEPDEDELWYEREHVETYACPDDKIKYIKYDNTWEFPDGYTPTITEKQKSYIGYLFQVGAYLNIIGRGKDVVPADKYNSFGEPYITSVELASKWISDRVDAVNATRADDQKRDKVVSVLEQIGLHGSRANHEYSDHEVTTLYIKDTGQFADADEFEFKPKLFVYWNDKTVKASYTFISHETDYPIIPECLQEYINKLNDYQVKANAVLTEEYK